MRKTYLIVGFVFILSFLMSACSGKKDTENKLGKMEVEIPDALKDKPEVVAYINQMAEVSDEYAVLVDEIMDEAGHLSGVSADELSMMEKLKLVTLTAEVAAKSTEIMSKWAEYQNQRAGLEEQMSDEELEALSVVWTRFEERMAQIDQKYNNVLPEESN